MTVTVLEREKTDNLDGSAAEMLQKTYKLNGSKGYFFVKRCFDIVASLVGGLILLIPMAIVAALIWLESPGPAIYSQERLGKDGEPFTMYKFRSMYLDAEKNGPQWAKKNDHRCTRVGRVIRMYHIDELPQLLNILRGEMTIVGPRPERSYFYDQFEKDIPEFRQRLRVKPGLTGLSQVNGCYDMTPQERIVYDIEYMETMSVWTDLKCILKTFLVVFSRRGAR